MTTDNTTKPDPMAKARAAQAAKREAAKAAPKQDDRFAQLLNAITGIGTKVDEQMAEQNRRIEALASKVNAPVAAASLPKVASPENALANFAGMKKDEQRQSSKIHDIFNPRGLGFHPKDIVSINGEANDEIKAKVASWRKSLKIAAEQPIYAEVQRSLGTSGNGQGERKYRVHIQKIGGEGLRESELELVERAS